MSPVAKCAYNAVLALAYRGSSRIKDEGVWDVLLEMLDEGQQMQNYTPQTGNLRGVVDETAARTTVISGLQAAEELHRKQPQMDLSGLKASIEKLTQSPNATVSVHARRALERLIITAFSRDAEALRSGARRRQRANQVSRCLERSPRIVPRVHRT